MKKKKRKYFKDELKIELYDMNHKNRGTALILNFENFENDPVNIRKRIGSELDTKALETAFFLFRLQSWCT